MKTIFHAVNLLGMLFGIPLALLGVFLLLDPITLVDAALRETGLLLLAGLSVASLVSRQRPWLGALGLCLLVSIWTVLSWLDLGVMSEQERNAYAAVLNGDTAALQILTAAGAGPDERLRHPEDYTASLAYANKTRQSRLTPADKSCWLRFEALLAARNG